MAMHQVRLAGRIKLINNFINFFRIFFFFFTVITYRTLKNIKKKKKLLNTSNEVHLLVTRPN